MFVVVVVVFFVFGSQTALLNIFVYFFQVQAVYDIVLSPSSRSDAIPSQPATWHAPINHYHGCRSEKLPTVDA